MSFQYNKKFNNILLSLHNCKLESEALSNAYHTGLVDNEMVQEYMDQIAWELTREDVKKGLTVYDSDEMRCIYNKVRRNSE